MSWCNKLLEIDPESVDALCDRAELYISNEQYEEAIKDYQAAQEINNESPKVSSTNYEEYEAQCQYNCI